MRACVRACMHACVCVCARSHFGSRRLTVPPFAAFPGRGRQEQRGPKSVSRTRLSRRCAAPRNSFSIRSPASLSWRRVVLLLRRLGQPPKGAPRRRPLDRCGLATAGSRPTGHSTSGATAAALPRAWAGPLPPSPPGRLKGLLHKLLLVRRMRLQRRRSLRPP